MESLFLWDYKFSYGSAHPYEREKGFLPPPRELALFPSLGIHLFMIDKHPLISVLIPVYNAQKFLTFCLDSVCSQSYSNIEIICVDDGSADASFNLLKQYAQKDSRIKIFHQDNLGVGAARNRCLSESKGEFFAFVDADDSIVSTYVETLLRVAIQSRADIVRCCWKEVLNGETKKAGCSSKRNLPIADGISKRMMAGYYDSMVCGKLIKRKLITQNHLQFNEHGVCEDLSFAILLFIFANKIVSLSDQLYIYCRDNTQSITKHNDRVLWGRLENLFYVSQVLQQHNALSSEACQTLCYLIIWHLASLRKVSKFLRAKNMLLIEHSFVLLKKLIPCCNGVQKVIYTVFLFVAEGLRGNPLYIWCKLFRFVR